MAVPPAEWEHGGVYVPEAFAERDPDVLRALIDTASIASLVTMVDGALFATTVPLLYDDGAGRSRLIGHLARKNPQAGPQVEPVEALAIFAGADGYVSPSMYPSKAEHGRVVPTWNYESVHVWGPLILHDDPTWTLELVSRLTDHHESRLDDAPWGVTDAPTGFIDAQLKGIVGIEIPIVRMIGKRKLSQNRSDADRAGVVRGFVDRVAAGGDGDRAMAERMTSQHD